MSHRSIVAVYVHVVWATFERRQTIDPAHDGLLRDIIGSSARDVGSALVAIGNASDHVHVVARVAPTIAVAEIVRRMKGRASFIGRWRWQQGYFAESVAFADLDPLARYLDRQRHLHDDSHPAESWAHD